MEIHEESLSYLEEYARVPIAFEVNRILDLSLRNGGIGLGSPQRADSRWGLNW